LYEKDKGEAGETCGELGCGAGVEHVFRNVTVATVVVVVVVVLF